MSLMPIPSEHSSEIGMYRLVKRLSDIIAAFIGLAIASPILLIVTLLLSVANGGKPFFFQTRPGKNERFFKIIKFRTMNDKKDSEGVLLPDSERLTYIGGWVRKLSLDELPQLINVLKGEMSLIGPRPLLIQYLPLYNDFQRRRHEVRPGISGWAQVNGRNNLSWKTRFEHDIYYIDHLSLAMDLKILLLTVKNVVLRTGINQKGAATMEPFSGNE